MIYNGTDVSEAARSVGTAVKKAVNDVNDFVTGTSYTPPSVSASGYLETPADATGVTTIYLDPNNAMKNVENGGTNKPQQDYMGDNQKPNKDFRKLFKRIMKTKGFDKLKQKAEELWDDIERGAHDQLPNVKSNKNGKTNANASRKDMEQTINDYIDSRANEIKGRLND